MESKGRILGDTAQLGYASKDNLTATLRHHECLHKSMDAGAPTAARDAIATRIETLKQAVYAKEPVHVQLVKVHAALTRGRVCGEEAADKADQHVLNLRQRMAELMERVYTEAGAHMTGAQWSAGEWHDAGDSLSGWQWDPPGDGVGTQWKTQPLE